MTDDGDLSTCPMECAVCRAPGDCEDCLDCLYWPEVVSHDEGPPPTSGGESLPSFAATIEAARARIDTAQGIALALRHHRREQGLSQRALARRLDISRPALARAEADPRVMSLGRVLGLLDAIGYRLALVRADDGADGADGAERRDHAERGTHEVPVTTWPATDLLVKDAQGRRPPATADVRYRTEIDKRLGDGRARDGLPWTWALPHP